MGSRRLKSSFEKKLNILQVCYRYILNTLLQPLLSRVYLVDPPVYNVTIRVAATSRSTADEGQSANSTTWVADFQKRTSLDASR